MEFDIISIALILFGIWFLILAWQIRDRGTQRDNRESWEPESDDASNDDTAKDLADKTGMDEKAIERWLRRWRGR